MLALQARRPAGQMGGSGALRAWRIGQLGVRGVKHVPAHGPYASYKLRLDEHRLRPDEEQGALLLKLDDLHQKIAHHGNWRKEMLAKIDAEERARRMLVGASAAAKREGAVHAAPVGPVAAGANSKLHSSLPKGLPPVLTAELAALAEGAPREEAALVETAAGALTHAEAELMAGTPRGLYIHGPVGSGKTLALDLFHGSAGGDVSKRRAHLSDFMLDLHRRLHDLAPAGRPLSNPVRAVAKRMAEEHWLLCLDELLVADVADMLLLRAFLRAFFARGGVLVTTSNRPPDELYAGGYNRSLFHPAIRLLKERCDVHHLGRTGTDYRLLTTRGPMRLHFETLTRAGRHEVEALFEELAGAPLRRAPAFPLAVPGTGRVLRLPHAAPGAGVAWAAHEDLLAADAGPADFAALARGFHTVFLVGVRRLGRREEGRRLAALVDALYDAGVRLVLQSDGPPEALFPAPAPHRGAQGEGSLEDAPKAAPAAGAGHAPEAEAGAGAGAQGGDGEERALVVRRAVSRLREMQSLEYALRHRERHLWRRGRAPPAPEAHPHPHPHPPPAAAHR